MPPPPPLFSNQVPLSPHMAARVETTGRENKIFLGIHAESETLILSSKCRIIMALTVRSQYVDAPSEEQDCSTLTPV